MDKLHYNISGLINTEKKTQIKNALNKIDGVKMVNVDMARGSIEVGYDPATSKQSIADCIEHVGCQII
ncbi:MAG: heavy-metal-associated domain-containing protein [Lachnospiraceae bacterium]|nr:heavy-metal-associated domain-containing protein [Lachnospiraceae bacterium]